MRHYQIRIPDSDLAQSITYCLPDFTQKSSAHLGTQTEAFDRYPVKRRGTLLNHKQPIFERYLSSSLSTITTEDKSQPLLFSSATKDEKLKPFFSTDNYTNKPSIFEHASTNGFGSKSICGNTSEIKNSGSGFQISGFGNSTTTTSSPLTSTVTGSNNNGFLGFQFGNNSSNFNKAFKFSFGELAKPNNNNSTDGNDRVFPYQGTSVSGSTPKKSYNTPPAGENDDTGSDANDSYEPSVTFHPIIKLVAVDVQTGEEDETVLFCERAKLYRYDNSSNSMKERGIGEMKILQHKQTKVCRILMRREQVLKVCANHQISSTMEMKSHHASDNAYVWNCLDYADNSTKQETFCVKFKTSAQAKQFNSAFNDAKKLNENLK
ncbi:unnamed protein product [Didymodactylos carnosus]|uniref:RanBD1 domain-containing protein n=1 Tax=Didymodactylos carnosus TaxID=1234261 RepID=A0A815X0I3_9BILA|nr:unnamed protein product [Didymodactylos carnosus]CAF1550316.1 unnamed protein product [Didymodactylos carnosus]CAF4299426.1 unnamed protein product [Didymodactylos carnosus]CAF4411286.1 unnamed protein product [Didymodactylos carnosus]